MTVSSHRTKLPLCDRIDALSAYLSMRQLTALEAEEAVTTLFDARAEVYRLKVASEAFSTGDYEVMEDALNG